MREGSATDAFTQCPEVYTESRCFSIIHGDDFSTLDLVFPTQEESLHWTVGLRYLLAKNTGRRFLYRSVDLTEWIYCIPLRTEYVQIVVLALLGYDIILNVYIKYSNSAFVYIHTFSTCVVLCFGHCNVNFNIYHHAFELYTTYTIYTTYTSYK